MAALTRQVNASLVVVIVTMMAAMEHVMHAVADVAPGGGDGVTALAADVEGFVAGGAAGLRDVVANTATGVLGRVDGIGENGASRRQRYGKRYDEGFHGVLQGEGPRDLR